MLTEKLKKFIPGRTESVIQSKINSIVLGHKDNNLVNILDLYLWKSKSKHIKNLLNDNITSSRLTYLKIISSYEYQRRWYVISILEQIKDNLAKKIINNEHEYHINQNTVKYLNERITINEFFSRYLSIIILNTKNPFYYSNYYDLDPDKNIIEKELEERLYLILAMNEIDLYFESLIMKEPGTVKYDINDREYMKNIIGKYIETNTIENIKELFKDNKKKLLDELPTIFNIIQQNKQQQQLQLQAQTPQLQQQTQQQQLQLQAQTPQHQQQTQLQQLQPQAQLQQSRKQERDISDIERYAKSARTTLESDKQTREIIEQKQQQAQTSQLQQQAQTSQLQQQAQTSQLQQQALLQALLHAQQQAQQQALQQAQQQQQAQQRAQQQQALQQALQQAQQQQALQQALQQSQTPQLQQQTLQLARQQAQTPPPPPSASAQQLEQQLEQQLTQQQFGVNYDELTDIVGDDVLNELDQVFKNKDQMQSSLFDPITQ